MKNRSSQRGAALLSVMLVFAAASVIATGFVRNEQRDILRTTRFIDRLQAIHVALGAETYARQLLSNENNATKIPALINPKILSISDGSMSLRVEDMQSRFNVNALIAGDKPTTERFLRLCKKLGVKESAVTPVLLKIKKTAPAAPPAQAADKDAAPAKEETSSPPPETPSSPPPSNNNAPPPSDGGTNATANSGTAPAAPANDKAPASAAGADTPAQPASSDPKKTDDAAAPSAVSIEPGEWFTDPSELVDNGLPVDDYKLLAPYLTALPTKSSAININTVSDLMLDVYFTDPSQVSSLKATLKSEGSIDSKNVAKLGIADPAIGYQSDAFGVNITIQLHGQRIYLHSLLFRKKVGDKPQFITISRRLGEEPGDPR